ncbi:hypothetical protein CEUSTIGMA_g2016.t1 [Chlamydomonas eustigma]|uniref:Uncharacterized protein n=1 Tax=Chlamydomonas eustigma TaxID=1157962 RepID=A0A250WUR7_9CHLO|nr:hypothetical protein CEUSTIGMA_g2016.t1 [Chlamydomonas eustigma]|eukprot:GAX74567.1 hypothetical protein CEUSTIGMA_g2016.t1 [Chlamydomonas eustigma]
MAPTSATMTECRAIGIVTNSNATPLHNTLRGLCSAYTSFKLYEAVLKVAGKATSIKMQRRIPPKQATPSPFADISPDRWMMVWESDAMRGPAFKDLPASVREVCEAQCFCANAPEFWKDLGAVLDYDMLKDGNEYICSHNGYEFLVQIMRFAPLEQPGNPDSAPKNFKGNYVMEVKTRVPEGKHFEGARALGSFGQILVPCT